MATIQISGLPASGALVDADITHVKQGTIDKKATVAQVKTAVAVPIQEEGSPIVTQPTAINFIGDNVTVTENGGVAEVTVIAPGGGGEDNLLINGNFDIWQREITFSTTSPTQTQSYTADRWSVTGTSNAVTTREIHTTGQTEVPKNPKHFLRVSSAANVQVNQRIEDIRTVAGQNITLSFYIRAASAVDVNFAWQIYYGSGGSGQLSSSTAQESVTVGSFQKHTFSLPVTSLAGKVVGDGSYFKAAIGVIGAPNNVDISQVKVEIGSGATPYVPRHQQQELSLCQRYYQKTYELAVLPGDTSENKEGAFFGTPVTGDTTIGSYHGPVRMRATPTATFYSARVGGASGMFWDVLSNSDRAVVSVATGETGTGVNLTVGIPSTSTVGGHIVLDAEL